jgi:hypothetical protein
MTKEELVEYYHKMIKDWMEGYDTIRQLAERLAEERMKWKP